MNNMIVFHGLRNNANAIRLHSHVLGIPSHIPQSSNIIQRQTRALASFPFGNPPGSSLPFAKGRSSSPSSTPSPPSSSEDTLSSFFSDSSSSSSSPSSRSPSFSSSTSKGSTTQRIRASSNSSSRSPSSPSSSSSSSSSEFQDNDPPISSSRASRRISDRLSKSIFRAKVASDLSEQQHQRDLKRDWKSLGEFLEKLKESGSTSSSVLSPKPQALLSIDHLLYQNNSIPFLAKRARIRWNFFRVVTALVYLAICVSFVEVQFSEPTLEDLLSNVDAEAEAAGVLVDGTSEEEKKKRKKEKELERKKQRAGKGKPTDKEGERTQSLLGALSEWLEEWSRTQRVTFIVDTSGSEKMLLLLFGLFFLRSLVRKQENLTHKIKLITTHEGRKMEFTYGLLNPRTTVKELGGFLLPNEPSSCIYEAPSTLSVLSSSFSSSSKFPSSSSSSSSTPPPEITLDNPVISFSKEHRIFISPLGLLLLKPPKSLMTPDILGKEIFSILNTPVAGSTVSSPSSSPSTTSRLSSSSRPYPTSIDPPPFATSLPNSRLRSFVSQEQN